MDIFDMNKLGTGEVLSITMVIHYGYFVVPIKIIVKQFKCWQNKWHEESFKWQA